MKKSILPFILLLSSLSAGAQVFISMDQLNNTINTELTFFIKNAKDQEPIAFASAYLIPQKDTIVTNFAISDNEGYVKLDEVVQGKYELNIEMMGFKPYRKEYSIKGWSQDLGTILLEEDAEFLEAARVTALADPITFDKDTIIYNAAAYRIGESAVLEDLLKLMPGMTVDDDGTVKVNGEKVDKITVGGKTFFFDDPSMTLKNLPAKFVDKIKVMDKTTKEAELTGIASKSDKEKVMDVQLKEEYKQGTFGNAKILGGASLAEESKDNLRENPGLLFNTSAMAAAYNENDQATILANAKNANEPGGSSGVIVIYDDGATEEADIMAGKTGIVTSGQAGANYNTARIKGINTNASVSYTFSKNDAKEYSQRTSFQTEGPDLDSESDFGGTARDNKIVVSGEIENQDNSKYSFYVRPSVTFTDKNRNTATTSATSSGGDMVNESKAGNVSDGRSVGAFVQAYFGANNLGTKGRSVTFSGALSTNNGRGSSTEYSETVFGTGGSDRRNLFYDRNNSSIRTSLTLVYVEPLTEKLYLQFRGRGIFSASSSVKDAFDGEDRKANDYYSTMSKNNSDQFYEEMRLQYSFDDTNRLLLGVSAFQTQNVTDSKTLGVRKKTGEGEWLQNWAPNVEYSLNKDDFYTMVSYSGSSRVPSGDVIMPTIDISNPLYISAGNIYLKPSFTHRGYLQMRYRRPKKGFTVSGYVTANLFANQTVYASWFDNSGIRYSLPVNSEKPSSSVYTSLSFNTPIGEKRLFNMSLSLQYSRFSNVGYQATKRMDGFDKDEFDYSEMMAKFWGDESGNLFYSGQSGFSQSRTNTDNYSIEWDLDFRKGAFSASVGIYGENKISRYSLDPAANSNIWHMSYDADASYITDNGLNMKVACYYQIYRGYSNGFNKDQFLVNASISKTVKSFTFSLKVADLLNQYNNFDRTVNAEYVEDVFRNALGRYILAGVSFNFGKMNAKNNRTAQSAMINMLF